MGNLVKETPYSEITATLELFDRYGVTRDHFARLRSDAAYAKRVAESVLATSGAQNLFPITVDYSKPLDEMIAAGHYDWKNSDITAKNFPVDGKGTSAVNIELMHFNRIMESDEVLVELDKKGLRPATLPELLAFGAMYPEKQRESPIVALDSVWRHFYGRRYVAYFCSAGSERNLGLFRLDGGWGVHFCFAAVRKTEEYPVTVNYDHRLERTIEDGHYDWKNSDINAKNFPMDGKGTSAVNIELVHFNRDMTSDEAYAELYKMGYRPATLPELLAFGEKYPEKQREFPIVALGSVWRNFTGGRYVAYLYGDGSRRSLVLFWLGSTGFYRADGKVVLARPDKDVPNGLEVEPDSNGYDGGEEY